MSWRHRIVANLIDLVGTRLLGQAVEGPQKEYGCLQDEINSSARLTIPARSFGSTTSPVDNSVDSY
jgi:hypothetical protein